MVIRPTEIMVLRLYIDQHFETVSRTGNGNLLEFKKVVSDKHSNKPVIECKYRQINPDEYRWMRKFYEYELYELDKYYGKDK